MTTPLYQRPQPMVMRVMDATNRGHGAYTAAPPPYLGNPPGRRKARGVPRQPRVSA